MAFDARSARLLAPGEYLIVDGCPGLRLKASESRRTWTYRYKSPVDGRMRQLAIGRWPEMSVGMAMAEWEGLRAQRDAGTDLAAEKKQARREVVPAEAPGYSVGQLCNDYIDGHIENARTERGRKEMRRLITSMIAPVEHMMVADVTRSTAFDLLGRYLHIPVTAATLRGELGAAWDYALDAGRIADNTPNWWRLVMRGKLKSKGKTVAGKLAGVKKRVLTEPEVGDLIRWLPNFSTLINDALTLYLWTGARGGELMSIEACEITKEKDGWWLTVPKAKTKNARRELATDLRIPLIGRALVIVQRRLALAGKGYLFSAKSNTGHTNQSVIGTQVYGHQPYSKVHPNRETPRLTVTHWAPHDLRRTARTMLAQMGCPDSVGEAILGHVQEGIKGTYNRYQYDAERRDWLTKLAVRLEALAASA